MAGQAQSLGGGPRLQGAVQVHVDEGCHLPDLVDEAKAVVQPRLIEMAIIAGRAACDQREAQGIGAELVNDVKRVDGVAQGLAEFQPRLPPAPARADKPCETAACR